MSATFWMGKQDLGVCDYVSTERERSLLDGEAGFEELRLFVYKTRVLPAGWGSRI